MDMTTKDEPMSDVKMRRKRSKPDYYKPPNRAATIIQNKTLPTVVDVLDTQEQGIQGHPSDRECVWCKRKCLVHVQRDAKDSILLHPKSGAGRDVRICVMKMLCDYRVRIFNKDNDGVVECASCQSKLIKHKGPSGFAAPPNASIESLRLYLSKVVPQKGGETGKEYKHAHEDSHEDSDEDVTEETLHDVLTLVIGTFENTTDIDTKDTLTNEQNIMKEDMNKENCTSKSNNDKDEPSKYVLNKGGERHVKMTSSKL
jgi:hypothetical protein